MMNKKLVGTALVGLVTLGLAVPAMAQVDNADGTTNVNGTRGENSGKMEVRGNLGEVDNENPETPLPEEDDKWINVTFPTATVFGQGEQDSITSPQYKMRNNSGRHVQVDVDNYVIDTAKSNDKALQALTELNIQEIGGEATKVNIAQGGVSSVTPGANSLGKINTKEVLNFGFTGAIDSSVELDEKAFVESHVVFKFKALPKDGNEK